MTEDNSKRGVTRRQTLGLMAGAAGAAVLAGAGPAMPAVRKKVELQYWTWADNPSHQKGIMDAVAAFNAKNEFITVTADASSVTMEARQKVIVAYAAGAAPDISGTVQTHVQDWYRQGILSPLEDLFDQWDESSDYYDSVKRGMRVKSDQPLLFLPLSMLPYILYYRADLFDKAGLTPPDTYEDFIAAAKALTDAPEVYGYALRGLDYYAIQPIEPILRSAGVKFVDENGNVDLDSDAAIAVTKAWVEMYTKDKSCQPTAINDRYPQLFSLMEQGKGAMWLYGAHANPQLDKALGERIQATRIPRAGDTPYTLANLEGNFITTACKEREAAFEFLKHLAQPEASMALGPNRGLMPVRKAYGDRPEVQDNRFFKVAAAESDHWWNPPFEWEHWANYQDKIAPYWQEALRENISVEEFQQTCARFLRGEA